MTNAPNTPRTALVIGCGIGGPVAAMALQKVGIEATVFEAHDGSAERAGSFLNMASNGLDALKAIDAHHEVLAHGFPTPRMVMWSGTGKRLGEVANGLRLPDGTVSITIDRGHLHGVLRREAIKRGIRIEQGKRLLSAGISRGGVTARFADQSEADGHLLIGVDGIHSRTRHLVDQAAPSPRYTGQLSIGGRAQLTTLSPTPEVFHMIFGRRAFFGYSVRGDGVVYWFANVAWDQEPSRESLGSIAARDWKETLLGLFADDAGPARDIVGAATDKSPCTPCTTCRPCRCGTAIRWSSSATPPTPPRQARARAHPSPSKMPSSSPSVSATAKT